MLARVSQLKQAGLTGNGLVASFIRRRVQPLMKRENFGFEYSGPKDSSGLVPDAELPVEVILDRLKRVFSNVSAMPARIDKYDAAHPPPEVSIYL